MAIPRRLPSRAALVVAVLCGNASCGDEQAAMPEADAPTSVVCLQTEYFPIPREEKRVLPYRLVRELARQAVLIAARDELGLATRDETLGEPFPDQAMAGRAVLQSKVRVYDDGAILIDLLPAEPAAEDDAAAEPAPPPQLCDSYGTYTSLAKLTSRLEAMSRGELVDRLRALGFDKKGASEPHDRQPADSLAEQREQMDFVSQYAAVRAAHRAIAADGPSPGWLGVLARGYAHLALLTQHHWKSDHEAFAARALLYAERMVNADDKSLVARAHRAYVWTIVGLHADALADRKAIQTQQDNDDATELPGWLSLVRPFCRFERSALLAVSEERPELKQIAQLLSFEQHKAYDDDLWLADSAQQTIEVCPEAYGVYAAMTRRGRPLGVKRMGAHYGWSAFTRRVPARVAELDDLPGPVRAHLPPDAAAGQQRDASQSEEAASALPMAIARALIADTRASADADEPSWAILGAVIAEEQFVVAAHYLEVATDATESSLVDVVANLLPLVKEHRYARHIESYSVNLHRDYVRFYEIIGDMQFVDPRGNMQPMFVRTWRAYDASGGQRRGSVASWHGFFGRNFTFPGLLEPIDQAGYAWEEHVDAQHREMMAGELARVAPHAPQTLRMKMKLVAKPEPDQLAEWEAQAGEDPQAFMTLAQKYCRLEQYDAAIRCYERSIALSPSKEAFIGLADAHRDAGNEELWQPTLERFFQVESLGLEHARVHEKIARELIKQEKWHAAEPHALQAAGTWSAWGLRVASDVYEGLQRWPESEKWVRELSNSYPTSSGYEWYFWCRRTGQGDVEQARTAAQKYVAADWLRTSDTGRHTLYVFNVLEENRPAALEDAKYLYQRYSHPNATLQNRVFHHLSLVFAARDTNEPALEKEAFASVQKTAEELRESDPPLSNVVTLICGLLEGRKPAAEELAAIDADLEKLPPTRRCNHEFFIARALDAFGDADSAAAYYRRAICRAADNRESSSLAGYYLARHEASDKP